MRFWKEKPERRTEPWLEEHSGPVSLGTKRAIATFILIMGMGVLLLAIVRMFL
jgi:hypothetical protein